MTAAALAALVGACGGGGDGDDGDTNATGSDAATTTTSDDTASTATGAQVCARIGVDRLKTHLPNADPKVAEPCYDTARPGVVTDSCSYKIGSSTQAAISLTRWESVDQARAELPRLLFKPTVFTGLGDEAMKGNDGNGGAGAAARFGKITLDVDLGVYSTINEESLAKAEAFLRAVAKDLEALLA